LARSFFSALSDIDWKYGFASSTSNSTVAKTLKRQTKDIAISIRETRESYNIFFISEP